MDTVRVLRLIEYIGPRSEVEEQVERSVHGVRRTGGNMVIRATTLGEVPEVLNLSILKEDLELLAFPGCGMPNPLRRKQTVEEAADDVVAEIEAATERLVKRSKSCQS